MGEPAKMTDSDRVFAHLTAMEIYRGVLEDTHAPHDALRIAAEGFATPPETMLLWLAQLLLQYRKERQDFIASHTHLMSPVELRDAGLQPQYDVDAEASMERARQARALYGKPSKAVRVRIDRGDFVRVSGMRPCDVCGVEYSDHDPVIGFPWLRHGCDGRLLKP